MTLGHHAFLAFTTAQHRQGGVYFSNCNYCHDIDDIDDLHRYDLANDSRLMTLNNTTVCKLSLIMGI